MRFGKRSLTMRERNVLLQLVLHLGNEKKAAATLRISDRTVEAHKRSIVAKVGRPFRSYLGELIEARLVDRAIN